MIVWSIHPVEFFDDLKKKGVLHGTYRRADHDFRPSYRWMAEQMCDRGIAARPHCPLWCWYAYGGRERRKPDLRCTGHLPTGTHGVRLELEVDEDEILLSQFGLWHCVLNGWYVTENQREADQIDAKLEAGTLTRAAIVESWQRIFDLNFGSHHHWGTKKTRRIQGCLPYIAYENVRRVDEFTAR